MPTEHFCVDKTWKPGTVASCPLHEKRRNAPRVRWGRKIRAAMDREAGVVGEERGGVYSDPKPRGR